MVANDGVKTNNPRKFGADIVGDIAWGTHLCQFYQTKQDMIDILVPYFVEGLRNNEFCMWITSLPLEVAEAKEELRKAIPDLDNCIQRGQIDIRSYTDWYLIEGQFNADKVLEEWVRKEKEALSRGFEGLRLTGNTFWIEKADWKNFVEYEAKINNVIGSHKMIALCTYSLEKCTGEDVADVIKNHVGTLIRKGKTWNLVEDVTKRKTVELELRDSEKKYRSLFKNMMNGLAYHKVLFGSDGKPADYVFLEVNDAFERLTGLRREGVVGRKVTDVFHGGGKDIEDLLGIYGKVAMTGEISQFDYYFSPLEKWYQIMAYCPEREFFIVAFQDITDHKRAEESLRQSEEKHRSLFDSMTQGVVYQDTSGNIISANHAAEMMLGLSFDEMMGRTSGDPRWRTIHEDGSDFPSDSRPAVVALRSGVPVRNVIVGVYNTKSNEYRWLKVDAVPQFRLGENKPYQVYTLFDDVTERKKADEALKENEAILHSFFESPGAIRGILEIVGDNVRLVSHNREAASFYGWRDRSVDGKPLGEIGFTKEEERSWVKNLNDARMASRPLSFEYARDTDSGRQWILFTLGRIEIETTTNPRFAFAGTDITRRKQIENESRETRDYLDSLLNYANAPIIVWDSEFKIKGFNHAFERLTGLSSNEVVGKNLDILFPQEKKEEAMAHILRTLAGEYWEAVEIPIIRTDGTVRTALWNSANVCDTNSKKIIATIAQGQDITERKKLEEKLKIAERMAGIGETAAMVGHDIRNPLQAILGYCSVAEELLNVETNDESHRKKLMEIFEQVKDQVRYTDKIVSNLRDYSTPVTAVPVRTDLRQLIEESRSLSHIPQTVIVSVNIPKTFHNAKVDPSILKRALVNLVTNAVQAMPNGGRLSVKVARRKNPATLVLSVGDTGVGIPKEDRSRIFVPLFTTKAKGQGLGLSACKCLIEAHDGTITFKSQTGKGSQFIIKIPLKKDR